MVHHHEDILHHGGLVQLHHGLYAGVVYVHQLQWGIHPDWTKRSPRHLSLECSAVQTSPHYCTAILSHHRPPKSLLSESQGPLLALMTGIMMHTIEHHAALTHRNNKGQDSLCLTLQGCAEALLEKGVPPWKLRVLPEMEPLAACG